MNTVNKPSPLPVAEVIEYLYANSEGTFDDLVSGTNLTRAEASLALADHEYIFTVTEKPDLENWIRPHYSLVYSALRDLSKAWRITRLLSVISACRECDEGMSSVLEIAKMTSLTPSMVLEIMINNPDVFPLDGKTRTFDFNKEAL